MKNLTKLLGIIALVAVIGFAFISCADGSGDTHTHSYSTTWSKNATQHWHECTANDGAKTDVANHTGDPCTVCGYSSGSQLGDTVINIKAIAGVTAPVQGATPVTAITANAQYTGTVAWNVTQATFAYDTVYTATITLTAKTGYTLQGVTEDFFTVAGTTSVSNAANSGVVTAVFPKTADDPSLLTLSGDVTISPNTDVKTHTQLTATYSGTEAVSFQWQKNGTNTGTASTTNPSTYTPTEEGSYTVIVSLAGYNSKSATVTVTSADLAGNLTISPNTDVIINTELTAAYTGSETGISYQWKKDGVNTGTNSNQYTPTEAGTYTVTVSAAGYNPKTSDPVNVSTTLPYIITGGGTSFTTKRGTTDVIANQSIQNNINAIRTQANGSSVAIQFGENDSTLNIGTASAEFSGAWGGVITLSGSITSADTRATIEISTISINSTANIANTSASYDGYTLINNMGGAVTISGGTISKTSGRAVYNNSTVTISGGTVSTTSGSAVSNEGTGTVTISGGTVSATTGNAVSNGGTGRIIVSGDAIVTSANTSSTGSTIYLTDPDTGTGGVRLNITGGTVRNTSSGNAVYNNSTGALTISGGTVSATTGRAVYNGSNSTVTISGGTVSATTGNAVFNNSIGLITVSGDAVVTSANTATSTPCGTIYLASSSTSLGNRLNITGGTVRNTSTGYAVYNYGPDAVTVSGGTVSATGSGVTLYNYSTGAVTISGGTVSATTGSAVNNYSTGLITISGNAVVTGSSDTSSTISLGSSVTGTAVRLNITGGTVENTAGRAVYNNSTGAVTISGGTVSATTNAVSNNSTGLITVSGNAVVTSSSETSPTIYLADSGTATAVRLNITGGTVKNTASGRAVSNDSTGAVTISNGTVSATTGSAVSNNNTGAVTISGGMISATGSTVTLLNNSTGTITISGGTVSATASTAVRNNSTGTVIISGGTVYGSLRSVRNESTGTITLRGNPEITGNIYRVNAAAVLNLTGTPTFAPESGRVYTLSYDTYTIGTVAVTGGSGFLSNFALDDSSYKLVVSGSNLVIAAN